MKRCHPEIIGFAVLTANGRYAPEPESACARKLRENLRRECGAQFGSDQAETDTHSSLRQQLTQIPHPRVFCDDPMLLRHLIELRLVNELHLVLTPQLLGGAAPTLTGPAGDYLPRSIRWKLIAMNPMGEECHVAYRRSR